MIIAVLSRCPYRAPTLYIINRYQPWSWEQPVYSGDNVLTTLIHITILHCSSLLVLNKLSATTKQSLMIIYHEKHVINKVATQLLHCHLNCVSSQTSILLPVMIVSININYYWCTASVWLSYNVTSFQSSSWTLIKHTASTNILFTIVDINMKIIIAY